MRIQQWDQSDPEVLRGIFEVTRAVDEADDPLGPPTSISRMRAILSGRANIAAEAWYATDDDATDDATGSGPHVEGWYRLRLPLQENLDTVFLALSVHPAWRRRGLGTELLRHAASRARANGRSVLACETLTDGAGAAFAEAAGATAGVTEARRFLKVREIPDGRIAKLRQTAEQQAAGYSLVRFTGPVPDEHLDGVAYVLESMNDAPSDHEDQRWDAQRVRDQVNVGIERSGHRCYTIIAVHDATGQAAGLTTVEVDPEVPEWAFQADTAVARPHRGYRLGLLLKTAMLQWLAEAEPGLRMIETGNAASNQYMISINEQLGFEAVRPWWQGWDIPVAKVLGA
jgi:GNAT superfamily N-acetyltransferase